MAMFRGGKYKARMAETDADVIRCQQLRYLTFIEERGLDRGASTTRLDRDEFDAICRHVMIEESRTGSSNSSMPRVSILGSTKCTSGDRA